MSEQKQKGPFKLLVPLDASGIEDFKPEKAVKVVLKDSRGSLHSQKVELDKKGEGTAVFTFDTSPGALGVFVGPEDATEEEMLGLQTISLQLPYRQWRGKTDLKIRPILITPYYWHWWLWWCRKFIIRGKVVCPDGSPVPGATVCAYDVDWWWCWHSKQLVGCAVTDMYGTFEIRFRWCCGWWPWWWWRFRDWLRDSFLCKRINAVLMRNPNIRLSPSPSNRPTLEVFKKLLEEIDIDTSRPLGPDDVGKIEKIRTRLLEKLPVAPELERLHIWPWYPWFPWWDCRPDIIFKVTQDCIEPDVVIVDEGVCDTRWNIPNILDVTLVANDKACCWDPCPDPPCEEGKCLTFTQVCRKPITEIGGNSGALPGPEGYLYPENIAAGDPGDNSDRPYGGIVNTWKNSGDMVDVDYYEIEYNDGSGWQALPPGAGLTIRRYWLYMDGGGVWHSGSEIFPYEVLPTGGPAVYESREHFEVTGPYNDWWPGLGNRLWIWGEFLVMRLNSAKFPDGTYRFRVKGYQLDAGNNLVNGVVLPSCGTTDDNNLVLTFDNRVIDPTLDTTLNPCYTGIQNCTVHICTTEPTTDFISVKIDGEIVEPCDVVDSPKEMLEIKFRAYDPGGHLGRYTLFSKYKENLFVDLLDLLSEPGASLVCISAGGYEGPTYGEALGQGATRPDWKGGTMVLTVPAKKAFPEPCCYQLELRARKRTVVNCDHDFDHCNISEYTLGVGVCPPTFIKPPIIKEDISIREPVIKKIEK